MQPRSTVVDTSTLVSAALRPGSKPSLALRLVLARFRLAASEFTLAELRGVLGRPKFDRYLNQADRMTFVEMIEQRADRVEVAPEHLRQGARCPDPNDAPFLALALACDAHCVISSDADLLGMHPFMGIEVLTPDAFLSKFER
jgi:putative PIN family toxin of toxin-antitoxin system